MPLFLLTLLYVLTPLSPLALTGTHLTDISIASKEEREIITLTVENELKQPISYGFDKGLARLTIPHSTFDPSIEYRNINDRFLRFLRFYEEGSHSILEIQFADSGFNPIGRFKDKVTENQIEIFINKTTVSKKIQEEEGYLISDTAEEPPQKSYSLLNESFQDNSVTINIIKMLVALAALLLIFYILLWVYNKYFVSRFGTKKGNHSIKLVSSYHISPKQKLVIVDVNNSSYACGVTANNISLIAEINDDSFQRYFSSLNIQSEKEFDFSKLRTEYLNVKNAGKKSGTENPKPSFSSELISKVRNLKPID